MGIALSQSESRPSQPRTEQLVRFGMQRTLQLLGATVCLLAVSLATAVAAGAQAGSNSSPNIVLILIDDLGYGDIGPFGNERWKTPELDRMAREGRRFSHFVVSSAVCSASRAAFLTGCYHERVGIRGALGPRSEIGLAASETTIAEVCKSAGYATACFGKWHLGKHREFLPLQHGFDEYYGLPYSNDMWPLHPDYVELPPDAVKRKQGYPDLPMIEDNETVDPVVDGADQSRMTAEFTRRAVDFIRRNRDQRFFLYLAHPMVHVPLFPGAAFDGKSHAGMYGDVVQEVDWSVGQILATLRELGLDRNTLVIFTADNGPWLCYGDHGGTAGPLREGKGTSWEGGVRVPTLMWWPGRIPAGSECSELVASIDLLPTVCGLVQQPLPELPIDGLDVSHQLLDEQPPPTPHEFVCTWYGNNELQAIRDRRWKLVFPHKYNSLDGKPGGTGGRPAAYQSLEITSPELYDLISDPAESRNLAADHPSEVSRLEAYAEQARAELGDRLTNREGSAPRLPGRVAPNQ
jgi:arylsulfatase A